MAKEKNEPQAQAPQAPAPTSEMKTISAKAPKVSKEGSVQYKLGVTLAENVEIFGEEVVNRLFTEQTVIKVQSGVRKCLENGQDAQKWANEFIPGTRTPAIARDPKAAARAAISKMTPEERLELIAQLQAG